MPHPNDGHCIDRRDRRFLRDATRQLDAAERILAGPGF